MVALGKKQTTRKLNAREEVFARYVVAGETQSSAWRLAYKKPSASDQTAAEKGSMIAARPIVQARIAQLRAKSDGGVLLSVNARLLKLADAMDFKPKTPADRQALARLTDVYTKIAGGASPTQVDVTLSGKEGAAPISVAVTVQRAPVRERIAALRAAKEARG